MEDSFNFQLTPIQIIKKSYDDLLAELELENVKHLIEIRRILKEAYGKN